MTILHASPPVGAIKAEPYDITELDALGDDRVFATILMLKADFDEMLAEYEGENADYVHTSKEVDEAREAGRHEVIRLVDEILDDDLNLSEMRQRLEDIT